MENLNALIAKWMLAVAVRGSPTSHKFSLLSNKFVTHLLHIEDSENVSSFVRFYHPNCTGVVEDETLTALLLLIHASFSQSDRLAEFRDAMCKLDPADQEGIASILELFREVDLSAISLEDLKTIIMELDFNVGSPPCVTPRRPIAFLDSPVESSNSSPLEKFFQTPRRKTIARGNCKSCNSGAVKILKSQLDDEERERTALADKLDKSNQSLQECERKFAREKAKVSYLQSTITNLEADLLARCQDYELLSDKLKQKNDLVAAINNEMEFTNRTCAEAISEVEQLRKANDVFSKQIQEFQQEFGSLDNLNMAQRRIAELEQALKYKTAEFEEIYECYQALKKPVVNLDLTEPSFEEPETLAGITDLLLGETRAENNELRTQIDSIVKDRDKLQEERNELETALLACKEDCVRKQSEIDKMKSDVVSIQKLLDTERMSNLEDIQVLGKNLSDISICLDNVTKQRDDTKSELATSEEAFQALKREITKLEKTLHEERIAAGQKVESLCDEMEKKVAKLDDVVLNYEEERRVAVEKINELEKKLCNANDLFECLSKNHKELEHTLILCRDKLDVKERELISINESVAKLNECVSNCQKVLEDERILSRQQIEGLVEKLFNANVVCEKLVKEHKELESDLKSCRHQLDLNNHDLVLKMEEVSRLNDVIAKHQKHFEKERILSQQRIEELEKSSSHSHVLHENLTDRYKEIQSALQSCREELDFKEHDLHSKNEAIAKLTVDNAYYSKVLAEERIASCHHIDELSKEASSAKIMLENLSKVHKELENAHNICKDQLSHKENELILMHDTVDQLNDKISNEQKVFDEERIQSCRQVEELRIKLFDADEEKNKCEKVIHSMEEELTASRMNNDYVQQELKTKTELSHKCELVEEMLRTERNTVAHLHTQIDECRKKYEVVIHELEINVDKLNDELAVVKEQKVAADEALQGITLLFKTCDSERLLFQDTIRMLDGELINLMKTLSPQLEKHTSNGSIEDTLQVQVKESEMNVTNRTSEVEQQVKAIRDMVEKSINLTSDKIACLENTVILKNSELLEVSQKNATIEQEFSNQQSDLAAIVAYLKEQFPGSDSTGGSVLDELKACLRRITEAFNVQRLTIEEDISKLSSELKRSENILVNSRSELSELQGQLSTREKDLNETHGKLNEALVEKNEVAADCERLQKEVAELKNREESIGREMSTVLRVASTFNSPEMARLSTSKDFEKTLENCNYRIDDVIFEGVWDWETSTNELLVGVKAAKNVLFSFLNLIKKKSEIIDSQIDSITQLEDNYRRLEERTATLCDINARLSGEVLNCKNVSSKDLKMKDEELSAMKTTVASLRKQISELTSAQISDVNEECQKLNSKLENYEKVSSDIAIIVSAKKEEEELVLETLLNFYSMRSRMNRLKITKESRSNLEVEGQAVMEGFLKTVGEIPKWSERILQWLSESNSRLPEELHIEIKNRIEALRSIHRHQGTIIEDLVMTESQAVEPEPLLSDSLEETPRADTTFDVVHEHHNETYLVQYQSTKKDQPKANLRRSQSAWTVSPPKKTSAAAPTVGRSRSAAGNGECWVIPSGPAPVKPARKSEANRSRSSSVSSTRSLPSTVIHHPGHDQLTERVGNLDVALSKVTREKDAALKENNFLRKSYKELEDKLRTDRQQNETNITTTRRKYEKQVENLKVEMKQLYNREITRKDAEVAQKLEEARNQVEKYRQRFEDWKRENEELKEQNRLSKEQIDDLRNQLWELGEKVLQGQGANQTKKSTMTASIDSWMDSRGSCEPSNPGSSRNQKASVFPPIPVEDEDDLFDNRCLGEILSGPTRVEDKNKRLTELQIRNSLCLPHLKSSYPAETQFHSPNLYRDSELRCSTVHFTSESQSLTDSSDPSMTRSLIPSDKGKKKDQTSYKRPGPPTPSKNGRLSLPGPDIRLTPKKVLRDQNIQEKGRGTPNRLKALFTSSKSSKRDSLGSHGVPDENSAPVTPRAKGLRIFQRKPFGLRDF